MTTQKITVGDYLLTRLKELGIEHIFGVPGDYNLGFLDQVVNYPGLEWVGTCNELNGAYAADGYARIKGASALVTTFGVGELSAINGIAGSYAEYIPVVHIVGVPAISIQKNKALVHHTLGDGRFSVFSDMYKDVTLAQAFLTQENAATEIDRVLVASWLKKRPVYIALPSDISFLKIDSPKEALVLSYPKSNQDAVAELVERVAVLLSRSKNPIILIDACAQKHVMKNLLMDFLEKTGIPFATMNMGKAILPESHPQFIGHYNGDFSSNGVQERVEKSDCIISFGTILSDFNTGGFTAKININVSIEIHSYYARVKQSIYENSIFCDTIPALTKRLSSYRYSGEIIPLKKMHSTFEARPITQKHFWQQMAGTLEKNTIVVAETGTSLFGALGMPMPDDATFIAQPLWGSIGYTVGALLGVCQAAPHRPVIHFIGDGSFQLTAQEISTLLRQQLTPTLFLLDNDGYTVERIIHGPTMSYNDIQHWDYAAFPKTLGKNVWSTIVTTEKELEQALIEREKHKDKMAFISVVLGRMDAPEALIQMGKAVEKLNRYH